LKENLNIGHLPCKAHNFMMAFYMIKLYDLKGRFFYSPYRLEKNGGESFFWILHNGGIIDKKGN
jgi:hypothetical protein